MKTLCTFPGRYGDLIWALPTMRAISRRIGAPVDLQIAGEFASIRPLVQQQPYSGAVITSGDWTLTPPEAWKPPTVPYWLRPTGAGYTSGEYDLVLHLGYRRWPELGLPFETMQTLVEHAGWPDALGPMGFDQLHLEEPWITVPAAPGSPDLVIAFSECHFELKLGLTILLLAQLARTDPDLTYRILTPKGSGWKTATWPEWRSIEEADWLGYARRLQGARVALCCNSGAHVLAVAMGVPVILYEPMESRHNEIFLPLGWQGPQVTVPFGNDGHPTLDYRHVADTIRAVLARAQGVRH